MGILNKIINNIKSEIASDIASELTSGLRDALNLQPSGQSEPVQTVNAPAQAAYSPSYGSVSYSEAYSHLSSIIAEVNFPGYTIETEVHPSVFDAGAHPKCFPISYLFKKDGKPVLAVLAVRRNQYRAMTVVGTSNVLDDNGIKYIRFFMEMENEKSYVINRIRENL